jgi:hypothetical protein
MDFGRLKLVKYGFWLGIGFMIPAAVVSVLAPVLMFAFPSIWQPDSSEMAQNMMAGMDKTQQIRVLEHRKTEHGKQVLVLGTIENTGPAPANSIQLEVEFFDKDKKMVYECSEYVSQKLAVSAKENFQVKCGCTSQGIPAHESYTVRVAKASSY